jgi:undecaprenyl-diphosphatase
MSFDTLLFSAIHALAGTSGFLDVFFVFLAKYLPIVLTAAVVLFVLKQKNAKYRIYMSAFFIISALISRGILTETIRFFYNRPRPYLVLDFTPFFNETTFSFPSGHAAFLFACAGVLLYFNRKWGVWFLIGAFVNGIARIASGMHWPTDILGGVLVSAVAVIIAHFLVSPYIPSSDNAMELEKGE